MDSTKLKNILKERLKDENRTFKFDSKKDTLRVENVKTGKGITVELPPVLANYENVQAGELRACRVPTARQQCPGHRPGPRERS